MVAKSIDTVLYICCVVLGDFGRRLTQLPRAYFSHTDLDTIYSGTLLYYEYLESVKLKRDLMECEA